MAETLRGEVLHVIPPEEQDEYEFEEEVRTLADARYVLVCREGGEPSWLERIQSFLLRRPIQAATLVSEAGAEEGETVTATVRETDIAGVYEATDLERPASG